MKLPRPLPLLLGALLAAGGCAVPAASRAQRQPGAPEIRVQDRVGARIRGVGIAREGGRFTLAGSVQGAWLRTASQRALRVEAFDGSGERIASAREVARLFPRAPSHVGVDSARFAVAIPDPSRIARIEVALAGD